MDLGSGSARNEERRPRSLGDVLDVNDRQSTLAERTEKVGRLSHCGVRAREFHGAAREIVVLEIDENEDRAHGILLLGEGLRMFDESNAKRCCSSDEEVDHPGLQAVHRAGNLDRTA